jgi:hypothetical protein
MTQDVSPGRTGNTRECYGNHPRPTRFSLRLPIAYNPRTIHSKPDLLVYLVTVPNGTQVERKFSHTLYRPYVNEAQLRPCV